MLGRSCEPAYQVKFTAAACSATLRAGRRLVRSRRPARRPRGELLANLAGKLTRGPARQFPGHVPALIRRLAAAAEGCRRAARRRIRVFTGAFRRWLGQLDLLKRT